MRMRQIALVAEKLNPVTEDLEAVLGLGAPYNDPGIDFFGLENAVYGLGGDFLEVVAPIRDNTAGGRYLAARGGDGGYMVILQCPDALAERERIAGMGIRSVWEANQDHYTATHFHPKDVGGILLSIDSVSKGADHLDPMCEWDPAGPKWKKNLNTEVTRHMTGVEIQTNDPLGMAEQWSKILDRPAEKQGSEIHIPLDHGVIRFTEARDGRGVGVGGLDIRVADPAAVKAKARERNLAVDDDTIEICGTRFHLSA